MPGGRRHPFGSFVDKIGRAMDETHDVADVTRSFAEERFLDEKYVDLTIQFIGASGLPRMDVVGTADPYFVAKLDKQISLVSTVQVNTLAPVWNELWKVKNVPASSDLSVKVMDKDVGAPHDDFIGKFKTSLSPGAKEVEIEGPVFGRKNRGTFWLKIESIPSQASDPKQYPYLFDGPIRYSRHCSPTVGAFTNINEARLYTTWKMYLIGVPLFFKDVHQPWNEGYKAAQSIFGPGPASFTVRSGIQAGHRLLYARSTSNGFGTIEKPSDVVDILHGGGQPNKGRHERETEDGNNCPPNRKRRSPSPGGLFNHRVKPAVYTYIISSEDDSLRFSETGAAFFVDFASKHALHSNCAQNVRYSGEFHPRPEGGWDGFSDDMKDEDVNWELVIDNNSGTYAPDKNMLSVLQALLEYNFPGFRILALDREDPLLVASREVCREYAVRVRHVDQNELEPHVKEGEETLLRRVSVRQ